MGQSLYLIYLCQSNRSRVTTFLCPEYFTHIFHECQNHHKHVSKGIETSKYLP